MLAASTLLLVACKGADHPGPPAVATPQSTSTSTTDAKTSGSPAPLSVAPVPKPLDVSRYTSTPCAVLTDEEAAELGAGNAEPLDPAAQGPACRWPVDGFEPGSTFHLYLTVTLVRVEALGELAKHCLDCASWAATRIAGYPAIHANGRHELKYGGCALNVAVTEHSYIRVTDNDSYSYLLAVAGQDAGKPNCDRADRAAAALIQKLEAGG